MTDKKTLLVAQLCITFMMALSMSGIMGLLVMGPTAEWLQAWPRQFITAWPIAFVLTLFTGRIGFAIAHRLVHPTA
ncbi:DUF2798 domain-containing protein [Devosia sp. 1566]|uniref:DUF2798 domain-containing protein n=1 Tax=Devosia sp. 1566 TaxID=2499144 RepID=UPI000FDAF409|nr:DUF2798 domain-containing protein [Devosia sp. 1566]